MLNNRPLEQRQEKEMMVYDLLENLHVSYERVDHQPAMTMNDIIEAEKKLNVNICKNLFLVNSNKSQYYLLMMAGYKKFKTKIISQQINSSRLSFAGDDAMLKYLNITPGSVSVMGLRNDQENHVKLLIDEDILKDEYIGFHPCINTSSVKIKTQDLLTKVLPAINHDYSAVKC